MITDYFICCASSKELLQETVKKAISAGWQPLGGVAVEGQTRDLRALYYQAIVRVDKGGS
jgi:hypothetical protein